MAHKSLIHKNPEVDLRLKYRKHMDIAVVVALVILIGMFYAFQKSNVVYTLTEQEEKVMEVIDAPPQTQAEMQAAPSGPSIPVEAESEDEIDDETIDNTELAFEEMVTDEPPPPPPDADDDIIVPFAAVSDRPVLKKRIAPIYPELAKKAGLEGMVTVSVLIGTDGRVEQVKVLKSIPMLDEAAISAAKQYEFTPAKQRDRVVKVWMAIPIVFKLKN